MGLKDTIVQSAAGFLIERPGKAKSLDEWQAALAASGAAIDERAAAAKDPVKASIVLRHISGIERWGQRRLQVFLGEPALADEYDGYRPGTDLTLDEQRAFFQATRAETLALIGKLKVADSAPGTVSHNDYGPLSMRGWLRYLDIHASLESKKIATR